MRALPADRLLGTLETKVDAAGVWGGLVRQLSLVPDGRPQWREFEHIVHAGETSAQPGAR